MSDDQVSESSDMHLTHAVIWSETDPEFEPLLIDLETQEVTVLPAPGNFEDNDE